MEIKTVVIVGGGPSLTRYDVDCAEKSECAILGINDAYRICTRLDYLYACDRRWWMHHYTRVGDLPDRKFSLEKVGYPSVEQLQNDGPDGLSLEWPKIKHGLNS